MCAMAFWVDWYLYQGSTVNIKGARAILVQKYAFPCSVQKVRNTVSLDLPKNSGLRLTLFWARKG